MSIQHIERDLTSTSKKTCPIGLNKTRADVRKLDVIEGWIERLSAADDVHHEAPTDDTGGGRLGLWSRGCADDLICWAARWLIHEGPSLGVDEGRWWLESRKTRAQLADVLPMFKVVAVRVRRGDSELVAVRADHKGWVYSFEIVGEDVEVEIICIDGERVIHRVRAVLPCVWLWLAPRSNRLIKL